MVFANPLHGANLNSLRSGAQKLAFHSTEPLLQFSDFPDSCIFIHEGTIKMSPIMGLNVSSVLGLILKAIKSSFLLEKNGFINDPNLPEMSASQETLFCGVALDPTVKSH